MNIDKNLLYEIFTRYYPGGESSDACDAFWFVHDILVAEADATEQKEPYATRTINTLKQASLELMYMFGEVEVMIEECEKCKS